MQSKEEAQEIIGKTVKDLYGRYVGVAIGFSLETNGEVQSVAVDQGNTSLAEFPGSRLLRHEEELILVPTWKVDTKVISGEVEVLRKRISALDELKQEGGMLSEVHDDLRAHYTEQLAKLQRSGEGLIQRVKSRMDEISQQDEIIARFLVNIKVQFRSGEMDEAAFNATSEHFNAMKSRNAKEVEELSAVLSILREDEGQVQVAMVAQ